MQEAGCAEAEGEDRAMPVMPSLPAGLVTWRCGKKLSG